MSMFAVSIIFIIILGTFFGLLVILKEMYQDIKIGDNSINPLAVLFVLFLTVMVFLMLIMPLFLTL